MDKQLLDSLWNHYWVNTLSSSSLLTNAEYTTGQINDLAAKLDSWENGSGRSVQFGGINSDGTDKKAEDKLGKATKDSSKIVTEVLQGMMTQVIKNRLFNEHVKPKSCSESGPADQVTSEEVKAPLSPEQSK